MRTLILNGLNGGSPLEDIRTAPLYFNSSVYSPDNWALLVIADRLNNSRVSPLPGFLDKMMFHNAKSSQTSWLFELQKWIRALMQKQVIWDE
jgi:hypothetical protein